MGAGGKSASSEFRRPDGSDLPDVPETPEAPIAIDLPEVSEVLKVAEALEAPEAPKLPEAPEVPKLSAPGSPQEKAGPEVGDSGKCARVEDRPEGRAAKGRQLLHCAGYGPETADRAQMQRMAATRRRCR